MTEPKETTQYTLVRDEDTGQLCWRGGDSDESDMNPGQALMLGVSGWPVGTIITAHVPPAEPEGCHGLDTPNRVYFYENDFYPLSNFSAFSIMWKGLRFDTSEAAYHWEKFPGRPSVQNKIQHATSAHAAFKLAEFNRRFRRSDWDTIKLGVMRKIIRAKIEQHEYVKRKLLATGDRALVENSWRDDFWGWGPNRDGRNMLGDLWMELRAELRAGGRS